MALPGPLQGVPERDTKQLIAYAQQHHKIIIGPATVGGVQVGLGSWDHGQDMRGGGLGGECTPGRVTCTARHSSSLY